MRPGRVCSCLCHSVATNVEEVFDAVFCGVQPVPILLKSREKFAVRPDEVGS